ncbi:hypothetical protein [Nocardia sp. NPDC046763]|uniref:hypothetical protein n=1 Tax=Nocardia sp. NPDC046763 TaxID=3155256 RepID=UPI0033CA597F
MTKTLIDIPGDLMEPARKVTGGATKTETVRTAPRLLVRQRQHYDAIAWFADAVPFPTDTEPTEGTDPAHPR